MDDGKGEFMDWADREMARIGDMSGDPEKCHSYADEFLLDCLGACQWGDEAKRIRAWFNNLHIWYA